uniref:Uncharacterized protein n=1 Tax=Saimiri boliviensis boliviensis TaxID=39432 RepID=A0A2K6U1I3_SAIBB
RTPGTATSSSSGAADVGACGRPPNPDTFEEYHRKCKELFPIQMVALSTVRESSCRFGTKQLSPTEAFPVLVGDMDDGGSLSLGPGFRSKMAIQPQQSKFVNWQVDGQSRDADFTAVVTLGNPDVLVGSGILVLVYHPRPGVEGAVMSLAGKYTLNIWLATVTLGQAGMHGTYYHKASDQLQVGVELEAGIGMQDTSVSFRYQLALPEANLLFKDSVDSNWIVGATLEKKLPPLPLTLTLQAFLNHHKNKFQCSFGLTIRCELEYCVSPIKAFNNQNI